MRGMDETWMRVAASLAIGLLVGLERERHPDAKAGVRTFALLALLGALAALPEVRANGSWLPAAGMLATVAILVAAHLHDLRGEDPGTTTMAAGCVCYLLGALAGAGDPGLAGGLAIAVTALLYFKPEIEGVSAALQRHEQVSVLQFLVASFIVLPLLPDRGFGPYEALNPRSIWMMVVLIAGIGLASHVALRVAGERHGALLTGLLGGLVSSTATTLLYAKRAGESEALRRLAGVVVPLANLVPLLRIVVLASIVAPALLAKLVPVAACALVAGIGVTAFALRKAGGADAPVPESRNPAQFGAALRFAAIYAGVLLAAAWLSDRAGSAGLYAAAFFSGLADVDPMVLSALNMFGEGRLSAPVAVGAIALAYCANVLFKISVLLWYDRALAWRALWPLAATVAGGALGLAWAGG